MLSRIVQRLLEKRGVLLIAMGSVATLWLSATQQLNLYIHPRYNVFSIAAAMVGLVMVLWAMDESHEKRGITSAQWPKVVISLSVILLSMAGLLVMKPASLSSGIANQRGVNSATNSNTLSKLANVDVVSPFGGSVTTQLTVQDWASLLKQTSDQAFFVDKQANISGFITSDQADSDVFYVSRFVVSCCAVDARPIGVPVYMPGWQKTYQNDQWVQLEGVFSVYAQRTALKPTKVTPIAQPKDPYVY